MAMWREHAVENKSEDLTSNSTFPCPGSLPSSYYTSMSLPSWQSSAWFPLFSAAHVLWVGWKSHQWHIIAALLKSGPLLLHRNLYKSEVPWLMIPNKNPRNPGYFLRWLFEGRWLFSPFAGTFSSSFRLAIWSSFKQDVAFPQQGGGVVFWVWHFQTPLKIIQGQLAVCHCNNIVTVIQLLHIFNPPFWCPHLCEVSSEDTAEPLLSEETECQKGGGACSRSSGSCMMELGAKAQSWGVFSGHCS